MGVGLYKVLLAEDNASFSKALEAVLHADGRFEVAGRVRNGREAVALAHTLKPDAVVMDIEMPEVDGIEATRRLCPTSPVLAISGHDYEDRVLDIRLAGASDYVRKARVEDDLCTALAAMLQ